jgi:hypothetical protein
MIMRSLCTLPRFWAVLTLGAVCFSLFYAQAAEEEKDFLEHYYENPRPDEFVAQMKNWAADGTLVNSHARPALIAFISQVVRSNRDKVEEWFAELAGLTPEQKQVFFTGLLYSRTKEADAVMTKTFGKQYEEQKVEIRKILELPLDKKTTLDMLWGFYYATGSETAIRRIVSCFRFAHAPDDPDGVDIPDGYVPLYKELPDFAFGSLASNAERHPKVVEILEKLLKSGAEMTQEEKDGVYDVLSQILPEKYPYIDRTGKRA